MTTRYDARKGFDRCQQWRRSLVTTGTINHIRNGRLIGTAEWRTQQCGAPLFNDAARARGLCQGCATGWTHEHNYPIDPPRPDDVPGDAR